MNIKGITSVVSLLMLLGLTVPLMSADAKTNEESLVLVANGKAEAQIVIPENAFPVVTYAAEELQYHIEKATGATLPIVSEENVSDAVKHHIYLGDCKATLKAGIKFTEPATPAEKYAKKWRVQHLIRSVGNDLFMAGNDNGYKVGNRFQMTYHGTLFAVYDFLTNEMDVKWLWPGELGEVIPQNKTLTVGQLDVSGKEVFAETGFAYSDTRSQRSWQSKEDFKKYAEARNKWLLRQHMNVCNEITYAYGHYFYNAKYIERFLKKRPDFFQLLPDGKRGYIPGMGGHVISMCVSNPDLWKQEIEDWLGYNEKYPLARRGGKIGGGNGWMVNACENDTAAGCTCKACRAWDGDDPNFAKHDYWNGEKYLTDGTHFSRYQAGLPDDDGDPQPSLSDRYARFYVELQKEAQKHVPGAVVFGYAYANYTDVPKNAKLNDNIVISAVSAWSTFPLSDQKIESIQKWWEGWEATGARMKLRPNTLSSLSIYPVDITEEFAKLFSHHAKHGMVATKFDSLTGQWGVQAPSWYVFSRLHQNPDMPVSKILDEFYSGFGKADQAVRDYFAYFKQVCENAKNSPAPKGVKMWAQQKAEGYGWFGIRDNALISGMLVFTPEVLAKAKLLIEKAEVAAKGDVTVEKRVDFLAKGLKYITLATDLYRKKLAYMKNKNDLQAYNKYATAVEALMNYRKNVVEPEMIADTGYIVQYEKKALLGIDHNLTASTVIDLATIWNDYFRKRKYATVREYKQFESKTGAYDLDKGWLFSPAPDKNGIEQGWQRESCDDSQWSPIGVDSHWKDQPWGKKWKKDNAGTDYEGIGWYRLSFTLPAKMNKEDNLISLFFGAVDSNCKVWLNGKLVYDRKNGTWDTPFMVDIDDTVKREGENTLAVRVDHLAGAGGIWKKVWLVESD